MSFVLCEHDHLDFLAWSQHAPAPYILLVSSVAICDIGGEKLLVYRQMHETRFDLRMLLQSWYFWGAAVVSIVVIVAMLFRPPPVRFITNAYWRGFEPVEGGFVHHFWIATGREPGRWRYLILNQVDHETFYQLVDEVEQAGRGHGPYKLEVRNQTQLVRLRGQSQKQEVFIGLLLASTPGQPVWYPPSRASYQ